MIEVGKYVSIRRKHSAVKPAITESGRAHTRTQESRRIRSRCGGKLHRIDLLAAPLQHLTVNQQQRLASETTDERVA